MLAAAASHLNSEASKVSTPGRNPAKRTYIFSTAGQRMGKREANNA